MTLHLDARQRAMLQEMGITVWAPPEVGAAAAASAAPTTVSPAPPPAAAAPQALSGEPATGAMPAPVAAQSPPAGARSRTAAAPLPAASGAAPPAGTAPLRLHAARRLYPDADPAQTPAELGAAWLIVTESLTPTEPLAGDAGRLLDNMLRAMQLHRHPRVYLAALERAAAAPTADNVPAALADVVATVQPAMVLVLGHVAARAALGRSEPLGRLRAGPHQLAGCAAVVTYDPAFLLRSQDTKAAAWADLCRALALVRNASAQG